MNQLLYFYYSLFLGYDFPILIFGQKIFKTKGARFYFHGKLLTHKKLTTDNCKFLGRFQTNFRFL